MCGLTEKEILKAGIQNRKTLMETIANKFEGANFSKAAKMLEKFESSLDLIYNVRYSQNQEKTQAEREADMNVLGSSLTSLYKSAFELASYQITNDKGPMSLSYSGNTTYRYLKMEKIMQDSLNVFETWGAISPQMKSKIYVQAEPARKSLSDRVVGIDAIVKQAYKVTDYNDLNKMAYSAKQGKLAYNFIELKKYGINLEQSNSTGIASITDNLENSKYVMKEDFDDGKKWDNKDVAVVLKRMFIQDMERKGLRRNGLGIFGAGKTAEVPVVDPYKTDELPVINDGIEKTEELETTGDVGEPDKKGIFGKLKDSINIIITRFKNRNLAKLNSPREERPEDNSEYYASLVNNSESRLESSLDKYKYNVNLNSKQSELHVENINIGKSEKTNERQDDNDGR